MYYDLTNTVRSTASTASSIGLPNFHAQPSQQQQQHEDDDAEKDEEVDKFEEATVEQWTVEPWTPSSPSHIHATDGTPSTVAGSMHTHNLSKKRHSGFRPPMPLKGVHSIPNSNRGSLVATDLMAALKATASLPGSNRSSLGATEFAAAIAKLNVSSNGSAAPAMSDSSALSSGKSSLTSPIDPKTIDEERLWSIESAAAALASQHTAALYTSTARSPVGGSSTRPHSTSLGGSRKGSFQIGSDSPTSASSSSSPSAASSSSSSADALQKRLEVETNLRRSLQVQLDAVGRQFDLERRQWQEKEARRSEEEQVQRLQEEKLLEQSKVIQTLRHQVAQLSNEKAELAAQLLAQTEVGAPSFTRIRDDVDASSSPPTTASPTAGVHARASISSSASGVPPLSERYAALESLWLHERAEREALEVVLEAREIRDQQRKGSISEFDAQTGATIVDRRSEQQKRLDANMFAAAASADTSSSEQARATPSPPPMPIPSPTHAGLRAYANPLHPSLTRSIPDDLLNFDAPGEEGTIRVREGSVLQQLSRRRERAVEEEERQGGKRHEPEEKRMETPKEMKSPAPAVTAPASSPTSAPALVQSHAAPRTAARVNTTALHASQCITIDELDASKILAALAAKYSWTSSVHLAYFRGQIDEILEEGRTEETVREELRYLETEQAQQLQYELVALLGQGGFGSVYQATPLPGVSVPSGKAPVAIKVLDLEDSDDMALVSREVTAFSDGVSCDQLTRYYHSQVLGTRLWLIQEFVDGGSVLDLLKACKAYRMSQPHNYSLLRSLEVGLDEKYICTIIREVLLGLAFFEANNKLHRDIKGTPQSTG